MDPDISREPSPVPSFINEPLKVLWSHQTPTKKMDDEYDQQHSQHLLMDPLNSNIQSLDSLLSPKIIQISSDMLEFSPEIREIMKSHQLKLLEDKRIEDETNITKSIVEIIPTSTEPTFESSRNRFPTYMGATFGLSTNVRTQNQVTILEPRPLNSKSNYLFNPWYLSNGKFVAVIVVV